MVAEFSQGAGDALIVAGYAQWAGDFDHALDLYARVAGAGTNRPRRIAVARAARQRVPDADSLLRTAAAERYNALTAKIREFNNLRGRFPPPHDAVAHTPFLLPGRNLRGTLWRTGPRDFVLRAYLANLALSGDLKYRAGLAYREGEDATGDEVGPRGRTPDGQDLGSGGLNWSVPGDPFITVVYSDLGLVEARAFWAGPTPPAAFALVLDPLRALFDRLDPQ